VSVTVNSADSLVADYNHRRGVVTLTSSPEVAVNEEVLFGDDFEEIDLEDSRTNTRYYLMHEDNIKVIFGDDDRPPRSNVLAFTREKQSA
jgi:hypothetical protein